MFYPLQSQGARVTITRQHLERKKKKEHQVQKCCDVLKGLREVGILRASDDGDLQGEAGNWFVDSLYKGQC